MESTGIETDEKSNKVDFFYRLGTQTGMIVQGIQDYASSVVHSITGEFLDNGLSWSVKNSTTGFAK